MALFEIEMIFEIDFFAENILMKKFEIYREMKLLFNQK